MIDPAEVEAARARMRTELPPELVAAVLVDVQPEPEPEPTQPEDPTDAR